MLHIRRPLAALSSLGVFALLTAPAYAAGSNMPWEQPLNQILESIQGPVAKVISVIVIILTGLALAFGETSGGFRRLIQIVFGLSIAFAASSFFLRLAPRWRAEWTSMHSIFATRSRAIHRRGVRCVPSMTVAKYSSRSRPG